jgi:hypothetical protein
VSAALLDLFSTLSPYVLIPQQIPPTAFSS